MIFVKYGKFSKIGETWISNFKVASSPRFKATNWEAADIKTIFYFHANKTHFHKNGFALSLLIRKQDILKLGNGSLTEPVVAERKKKWQGWGG